MSPINHSDPSHGNKQSKHRNGLERVPKQQLKEFKPFKERESGRSLGNSLKAEHRFKKSGRTKWLDIEDQRTVE